MKKTLHIVCILVACMSIMTFMSTPAFAFDSIPQGIEKNYYLGSHRVYPVFATLPSGIEEAEIGKRIDSYFEENAKTNAGMSVAVFTDDGIIHEAYYGYADKDGGIIVDENTVMEWGSATKILVWISVMQLVESGEISLTEDISTYLPEGFLTKLAYDTPITMYNLMHHNAGWEEGLVELFIFKERSSIDLEATLRKTEPKQVFEPEEFTAYSNWGVALAGYIVERVADQPFDEYVHENIFDVLGMEHTALNASLSDNQWVKEKRNELRYYSTSGSELNIPHAYIPLYPAGMATGTLSDFLRLAYALIPSSSDETGNSSLFKNAQTLNEFYETSLYYADGEMPRNSHGLWASLYSVPVIGHGGNTMGCSANLLISPSSGVGLVIMTNQGNEGIYNYGIPPLIFGEYEPVNIDNMPDVAQMEGMYLGTRATFSGMMKWSQIMWALPFSESAENTLSSSLMPITAIQIEPYTYSFTILGMTMLGKASISDERALISIPMFDFVKVSSAKVLLWFVTLILFALAVVYSLISLIFTAIRSIKCQVSEPFVRLRALSDISVILCFINFLILVASTALCFGTYTSVFIQGIFFILFALIPVIFTVKWTIWKSGLKKVECSKKQRRWLIASSFAGLIMTFNVLFWNLYMIW